MKITKRLFYILLFSTALFTSETKAADYFWVNGTGNWSELSHWATTSGGSTYHLQVPTAADDVYFDANSFTAGGQTVTLNQATILCHNMDWTGATNTPTLATSSSANTLKIYGSLTLISGMTYSFTGPISFEATTTGNTVACGGKTFTNNVTFNGNGGGWILQDALTNTTKLDHKYGDLNTNGQTLTLKDFYSNSGNSRSIQLSTSTINMTNVQSVWLINATGLTAFDAGTSTINFSGNNPGNNPVLLGGSQTYYNLNFTGPLATGIIENNNTFTGTVTFAGGGAIRGNNTFNNSVTITANYASVEGNSIFQSDVTFGPSVNITGSCTFQGNTVFNNNANITKSNSFNNVTFSPGYTYTMTSGYTQTINGTLTANGNCGAMITIKSNTTAATTISHSSGSVTIDYINLNYITATGGSTFTANNTVDLGNNIGWTINALTSQNLYWVGNSGSWNDGNHWSTSSGGSASGCIPTSLDNVFFDANSFSSGGQTLTINVSAALCNNMDWTGAANNPTLATTSSGNTIKIYGSLTFISAMNVTYTGLISFEATSTGKTVTCAGKSFTNHVTFNGNGGGWLLQDALTTTATIYHKYGNLNTNGQTINTKDFYSNSGTSRSLNLTTSTINMTHYQSTWLINASGLTSFDAGTSTINFSGNNPGYNPVLLGGSLTYYNLNFTGPLATGIIENNNTFTGNVTFAGGGAIRGNNTFYNSVYIPANYATVEGNSLFMSDASFGISANITGSCTFQGNTTFFNNGTMTKSNSFNNLIFTPGYTYTLTSGYTQTINGTLSSNGNCGALITIRSNTTASANISHAPGSVTVDYNSLYYINATGGATFTANNSVDQGNNTGWTINAITGKNLYWVGNSGNWNDGNHWSTSSGGAASGCTPTSLDNVFFDANSFSAGGQTVTVNIANADCNDMDWTGAANTPTLATTSSANKINIYGSLTFISAMNLTYNGQFSFESLSTGKTVTCSGKTFTNNITFNGNGGGWILQDELTCTTTIYHKYGDLNTNGQTVNTKDFYSNSTTSRSLNFGNSTFNMTNYQSTWYVRTTGVTSLNAGTSTINFSGNNPGYNPAFLGGGFTYYNLNFTGPLATGIIENDNTFTGNVTFAGGGAIRGNNTIYNDIYIPANYASIEGNSIFMSDVTINPSVNITGSCNFQANTILGNNANITKSNSFYNLALTPGCTYTLTNGYTQTIQNKLTAQGSCIASIIIQSSSPGNFSTITKASGTVVGFNLHIKDIHAVGGAAFEAYNSVDLGGNTGWNFSTLPSLQNPLGVNGPDTVCSGQTSVDYYIAPVQGAISYNWAVPTNASIVAGQGDTLITVDFNTATSGNVSVEAFNGCGYSAPSALAVTILDNDTASVSIGVSPSDSVCNGGSVTFTATTVNGGISPTYKWQKNGIDIPGETDTVYITSTLINNDEIRCIMTSSNPCTLTASDTSNTITMKIGGGPTQFSVTGGGNYCAEDNGVAVGLDNSENGVEYQLLYEANPLWAPLDGTGSSISYGAQIAAGTYTIRATDTASGCQSDMNGSAVISISNCYAFTSISINKSGAYADTASIFDANDTTMGALLPRLSDAQRNAIPSPATGLLIYNTTSNKINFYCSSGWYEMGTAFVSAVTGAISNSGGVGINETGDTAINSAILDVSDDNTGVLIPRTLPGAILGNTEGLIIYNISTDRLNYYNGSNWIEISASFVTTTTGGGAPSNYGCSVNNTGAAADPSAILDISANNKGILVPRISSSQRDNILPATGLIIYNTTNHCLEYFDGTNWVKLI